MLDRRDFYDRRAASRPRENNRHYQILLRRHYAFLTPAGVKTIELGCGMGDLLNAVSPSRGVGVDLSPKMIELARSRYPLLEFHAADADTFEPAETFDYILLSDLVNDLHDVQALLERVRGWAHPRSRLVLNFFNTVWRPVLRVAEIIGAKAPTLPQNWLSAHDMRNLLYLAGWELIKEETRVLWPIRTPLLASFLNRWIAPCLPPLCLSVFQVARPRPSVDAQRHYRCSVIVPARNEAGNIEDAVRRLPEMGAGTEIIFVEGHSTDATWKEILRVKDSQPKRTIRVLQQQGEGKGNAVREAMAVAQGELLFILDADLTVPPEQLPKFYEAARSGKADFVNGVRLVYPMQDEAMRFLNMVANYLFARTFSWLLGQSIKDTLCGTKVLFKADYEELARQRGYFGEFDPFGDFDLLFGAAKLNLRIVDLPVRYAARTYGTTNIQRWRHGLLLARMVWFAARRLKFIP